jgi:hypothetical protein
MKKKEKYITIVALHFASEWEKDCQILYIHCRQVKRWLFASWGKRTEKKGVGSRERGLLENGGCLMTSCPIDSLAASRFLPCAYYNNIQDLVELWYPKWKFIGKINKTENKPNRPHHERIIKRENGRTEQPHRHHRYDCFATTWKSSVRLVVTRTFRLHSFAQDVR